MTPTRPLPRDEGGKAAQDARQQARRAKEGRTAPHPARAPTDPDPDSAIGIPDDGIARDKRGRPRPTKDVVVADKIERMKRVATIRKAILEGYNAEDIIRYVLKETDWKIEVRQTRRYIKQALDLIASDSDRDRKVETGKALERNDMILRAALSPAAGVAKDTRVAMRANTLNVQILGLIAPVRHRHGADPDSPPLPVGGNFVVLVQEVKE